MKYTLSLLLCLLAGLTVESCVNHDLEGPVVVSCEGFKTVSFNDDVKGIISTHCAISGCHNGDNGASINWTVLKNFQDHATEAKRRLTLPPSSPDKMPRVGSLSNDQIKLIVCWVEQGAKDN